MIGGAHHRTWRRRRTAGALLGLLALLVGPLPLTEASAAEEGTGLAWPDPTDWVRSVPYVFDVDLPGTDGELWAVVQGERSAVPSQGRASVDLTSTTLSRTRVVIERCPSAGGECEFVDASPDLQLYDDMELYFGNDRPDVGSTPNADRVFYRPSGTGTTRWQLLLADGSVVHTGQTTPGPEGWVTLVVPLGTPAQMGTLVLDVTLDAAGGGRFEKRYTYPARIDGVPPPPPVVTPEAPEIYPWGDQYLDEIDIVVDAPEASEVDLYARSTATGVTTLVVNKWAGGRVVIPFDGTVGGRGGRSLPLGEYELFAVSTDVFGQSSAASPTARITLRGEAVTTVQRTFRLRPADFLVKKITGRCGRLTRPGSRGRRGSIGLRASATCRAPRSYAQGIFTAWLPRGVRDSWSLIRVDVVGGPARGHAGDDMVMALYTDRRRWGLEDLTTIRGRGTRRYRGAGIEGHYVGRVVHEAESGRPYVAWTAGTGGDHQFDVDRFLLTVAYPDLRLPEPRG